MGYNPRGRKESDTTKRLHFHFHFQGQLRCHAFSRGFSHLFRAELGALLVILHFMPTFISLNSDDYVTVLSSLRVGTIFERVFF